MKFFLALIFAFLLSTPFISNAQLKVQSFEELSNGKDAVEKVVDQWLFSQGNAPLKMEFSMLKPNPEVTHGPIVGGVSAIAARVFVKTDDATAVDIEFSTDNFQTIAKTVSGSTSTASDYATIIPVTGLQPDTRYQLRVSISGVASGNPSTFKTFPVEGQPGNYKLLFGSCIYELDDTDSTLFLQMLTEDANIFTPIGDWGYPDKSTGSNDLYLSNPPTSWANSYNLVKQSYYDRYSSSNSGFFYHSIAMDYVFDDHDYLNDNSGNVYANTFDINPIGGKFGEPKIASQPAQARTNILKGYGEYFPSYSLVDSTQGVFHSYKLGNAEFFVLDLRSARTPQHGAIKEVGGKWVLQEPAGHSIMGQTQRDWLLTGLENSTADWKFIISSVTFNKGYKAILDSMLALGKSQSPIFGADFSGITISTGLVGASKLSDMWVGYPTDQQTLLNFITDNSIKNVFVLSGDAHSAALDDGANSGLPELMSANLKKSNSQDPKTLSEFVGYPLFNLGASGMGGSNLSNTYGKVEIFGSDSVRLSAVDASGTEVVSGTFLNKATSVAEAEIHQPKINFYPNPSNGIFSLTVNNAAANKVLTARYYDVTGREISSATITGGAQIDLRSTSGQIFFYRVFEGENRFIQAGKLVVVR